MRQKNQSERPKTLAIQTATRETQKGNDGLLAPFTGVGSNKRHCF